MKDEITESPNHMKTTATLAFPFPPFNLHPSSFILISSPSTFIPQPSSL
jgi:hypothetical protein